MSDDLTARLRELAEAGQLPSPGSGAEVRRLASARRRRRRTAITVAGAFAAAAVALALLLDPNGPDTDDRSAPVTAPTGTATAEAAPAATVDLGRRVLLVGRRELPVAADGLRTPAPTGRMTVAAREDVRELPAEAVGLKDAYRLKVPWVVELRAGDGTSTYLGGLAYDTTRPGGSDPANGWIGLKPADAKWLYGQLRVGDVVAVENHEARSSRLP